MKILNFRNPSTHVTDRTALNAMQAEWIAKNGGPRRFDRGFSGEWLHLKNLMHGFGYELAMSKRNYTLKKIGAKGRPRAMSWATCVTKIDEVLVANGRQPFRAAALPPAKGVAA